MSDLGDSYREPEEDELCNVCNGSGEGPADGTRCWKCKGDGTVPKPKDNDI